MEKQDKINFSAFIVPIVSFFLALLLVYLVLSGNGLTFTGEEGKFTGLISDARGQYIAFFRALRNIFQGKADLSFTMGKVLGGNMMSLASYYLISPFNLLLIIFPNARVETLMLWIEVLKISTAGCLAGVYFSLSKRTKKNGYANIAFALAYALCSYSFGYMWDLFWLDGFLILPLVALGLENLVEKNHYALYVFSIAYALFTSWYTGYMVCAFAVLYFLSLWLSKPLEKNKTSCGLKIAGSTRYRTLWIFLFTTIGAAMIALPMWSSLLTKMGGTKAGTNIAWGWRNPLDVIRNLLTGTYQQFSQEVGNYQYDSFVGIYVGGACLVFASLYFFSTRYELRERICDLSLLIVFFFIVICMPLDTLMHGLSLPTWFPCRYAFLIAFLLTRAGARGYAGIRETKAYGFFVPIVLLIVGLVVGFLYQPEFMKEDGNYTYNFSIAALALYLGALGLAFILHVMPYVEEKVKEKEGRIKGRKIIAKAQPVVGFGAAVVITFLCAYGLCIKGNEIIEPNTGGYSYTYTKEDEYLQAEKFQKDVDALKKHAGNEAYRLENTWIAMPDQNSADNDPMFYGYNGLSHSSSVEKKEVQSFFKAAGYHSNGFFDKFGYGGTLAMDSFFGLKYIIDNRSNKGFNLQPYLTKLDIESVEGNDFYLNPYALPLAFAALPQNDYIVSYWNGAKYQNNDSNKTYWLNQFEWQNQIFQTLLGAETTEPIFHKIDFDYVGEDETGFEYSQAQGKLTATHGIVRTLSEVWVNDDEVRMLPTFDIPAGGAFTYVFKVDPEQPVYWYFKDLYVDSGDVTFIMDGTKIENQTYWNDGIVSFKPNSTGTHTFILRFNKAYENLQIRDGFYVEDLSALASLSERLKANSVQDTLIQEGSSLFKGRLTLKENPGMLFITIPYESGLKLSINGKNYPLRVVDQIFAGADISDLEPGTYDIVVRYVDESMNFAIVVALLTMLGWGLYQLGSVNGFGGIMAPFVLEGGGYRKHIRRFQRFFRH